MCDLDHFKAVNDLHGHATGDAVLERVAGDLLAGVRAIDTVARVGGEELALLLVDCPGARAKRVAERLRRRVARDPVDAPRVTISIGVADSSLTMGAEALLAHADRALYEAKRAGRNRVCCATAPPERPLELVA
jgi:diguanylate cyclase (GGDEF)-like protein